MTTVTNRGTASGTNVVVTDTLRNELRIDSVNASGGVVNITGQTVTVTYANIAPGQTVTFSIFTTVLRSDVVIDNTACVVANGTTQRCATAPSAMKRLPATGEAPMWRDMTLVMVIIGIVITLLSGVFVWRFRRAD